MSLPISPLFILSGALSEVAGPSVVWLRIVDASGPSHEPRGVTSKRRVEILIFPVMAWQKKEYRRQRPYANSSIRYYIF